MFSGLIFSKKFNDFFAEKNDFFRGGTAVSFCTQWQADLWLHGYDLKCICGSLHDFLHLCMFACMSTFDIIFKPNQNLCLWLCLWCASIKTHVFMYVDINAYICRCVHPCIHKMVVQGSSHFIGSVICSCCSCCAQPFIRQTSLRCKACFSACGASYIMPQYSSFFLQSNSTCTFHECETHTGYTRFCPHFSGGVLVPQNGTTSWASRISGMRSDMWSSRGYSEICP